MTQREGSRISLSRLKYKSAGQSVPSVSFKFNPVDEQVSQICNNEEGKDGNDKTSQIQQRCDGKIKDIECDTSHREQYSDVSPVKDIIKTLTRRSSSLDCNSPHQDTKAEGNSIISRLTKTLEEKVKEIRHDKLKVKDTSFDLPVDDSIHDRVGKLSDSELLKYSGHDEKESTLSDILSSSPSKVKSSFVHDLSEQTTKLKSELENIRPKFNELRHRKSSKDVRPKSFNLSSLLNRDEGSFGEPVVPQTDEVDFAEEAQENGFGEEKTSPMTFLEKDNEEVLGNSFPKQECFHADIHYKTSLDCIYEFLYHAPFSKQFLLKFIVILILFCFVLPIPRFIAGLVFGVCISTLCIYCILHLFSSPHKSVSKDKPAVLLNLPAYEDKELYQGWMNELEGEYNPETYHVSLSHTVYIRLQGARLLLDHPKKKIPKHARVGETLLCGGFHRHREYDLKGCQVFLLPRNLPRRWLWSRKYPICLCLMSASTPSSSSSTSMSTPLLSPTETHPHLCETLVKRDNSLESLDNCSMENNASSGDELSSLDITSFEEITPDMCQESRLYLFTRTDREKDDWFRRFLAAASVLESTSTFQTESSVSPASVIPVSKDEDKNLCDSSRNCINFERFMSEILHKNESVSSVKWLNIFIGRIFFDFLHDPYWANKVQERIQRKLSKLHIPYFMGEIILSEVQLGDTVPKLLSVGCPNVDSRGLWIEMSVSYHGNLTLSLETKLDLMKLKKSSGMYSDAPPSSPSTPPDVPASVFPGERLPKDVRFDTDEDDSLESSSEEEGEEEDADALSGGSGPASRKFLKIVDTVTASKYFQQASEWGVMQRAMQGVSRTRIELTVVVRELCGTLAVNVPPPPTDRIWYGFKTYPSLVMEARPRLGDRNLNFLADIIQKQLRVVFDKVFVLPNMDDLVVPIMSPILPGQKEANPPPWEISNINATAHSTSPSPSFNETSRA